VFEIFSIETVHAAEKTAQQLLNDAVTAVVNPIIVLFFLMAMLIFVFGVFEFIKGSDSDEARSKGQKHMISGIIGLLIMVSTFAVINFLVDQFGIRDTLKPEEGFKWILDK